MKILCVHNYYRSHLKGGEDTVFENEVSDLKSSLGEQNVLTYTVTNDYLQIWKLPFTLWSNRSHARAVYQLCKKHRIDVVHVHNFFPLLTTSLFNAAKKAGAKVVHTLHNYRWWCLNGTFFYQNASCERCALNTVPWLGILRKCFRGSLGQSLLAGLAFGSYKRQSVFKAMDSVWVLSAHQQAKVKALWPDKLVVLKPNGITIPKATDTDTKKGFVFVGRLEQGKGIETLLELWAELDDSYSLTVIGGGELETSLRERYTHKHITFMGTQMPEVVAVQLEQAKYCLHTSLYYETFGLVILESLVRGTPVIGFPIGTRPEFIQHGVNGYLVQPDKLKNFLIHLKDDGYEQMSQRARESALRFNRDAITIQQIALYRELIDA